MRSRFHHQKKLVASDLGRKIKQEIQIWRVGALPGLIVIGLIILARLIGSLQFLEWVALDCFLRLRPPEPVDPRILIVGINEEDIQSVGKYPIPGKELALVLKKLQMYKPKVIGLDIFRDLPIEPGQQELTKVLRENKNIIGIEKVLPDQSGFTIDPPIGLPPERVGFADAILDADGYLRRSLLGTSNLQGEYKFSLTIRIAETYLSSKGISLENGTRDSIAMRFGSTELTRFRSNSGGYVRADAEGNQILINFRSGREPFKIVSFNDVKMGKVKPSWIQGRIVLIGVVALSAKDFVNSSAVAESNPGLVSGVEAQAHAVSQVLSAVLDKRSLLKVWSEKWEYLWIFVWGFIGIGLGRIIQSPSKILLGLGIVSIGLVGICYVMLLVGWWIPVVPALLTLFINGAGLTASLFYRQEQDLRFRLQDRQSLLERTFDAIHNGPLQTLAKVLRRSQEDNLPSDQLLCELQHLDREMRAVYESVRRETLTQGDCFYLDNNLELDLNDPLHEILYEVYSNTTAKDFPCFKTLKIKVTKFEYIDSQFLNVEQKQSLCRFLEEALCNAGKYAVDMTRLEIICTQENGQNVIRVTDNGIGIQNSVTDRYKSIDSQGRGTQQAKNLARQLGGKFRRSRCHPRGTVCELTWPIARAWFWFF